MNFKNALRHLFSKENIILAVGIIFAGACGWYVIDATVLAPNDPCREPHVNIPMCNSLDNKP